MQPAGAFRAGRPKISTSPNGVRPARGDYSLKVRCRRFRLWADIDQDTQKVIAYHGHLNQQEQETTITWMAVHVLGPTPFTRGADFSTGEWDGDVLS